MVNPKCYIDIRTLVVQRFFIKLEVSHRQHRQLANQYIYVDYI